MTNHHDPYEIGYRRATKLITISQQIYIEKQEKRANDQILMSMNYMLQFAYMKQESRVIVYQDRNGETNSSLGINRSSQALR